MTVRDIVRLLNYRGINVNEEIIVNMLDNVGIENANSETEIRQSVVNRIKRSYRIDDNITNKYNLAFKCIFCDGGCNNNCLGFKGVCSPEKIRMNIQAEHDNCVRAESKCKMYNEGRISYEELTSYFEQNHIENPMCYESSMLIDWRAGAGQDIEQNNNRSMPNTNNGSLAILTTELPIENGNFERVIFGVFIIEHHDVGGDNNPGYVKGNRYCIELSKEEAKEMKFWKYYMNENNPSLTQWGTGLYRYMYDITCARILKDIKDLKEKKGAPQEEVDKVKSFLRHYCVIKHIDINNIPQAAGTLS